jgi:hypothetical protein
VPREVHEHLHDFGSSFSRPAGPATSPVQDRRRVLRVKSLPEFRVGGVFPPSALMRPPRPAARRSLSPSVSHDIRLISPFHQDAVRPTRDRVPACAIHEHIARVTR